MPANVTNSLQKDMKNFSLYKNNWYCQSLLLHLHLPLFAILIFIHKITPISNFDATNNSDGFFFFISLNSELKKCNHLNFHSHIINKDDKDFPKQLNHRYYEIIHFNEKDINMHSVRH